MVKEIPLTKGHVAIVDDEDYEYLNQWKWCSATGYASRVSLDGGKRTEIRMHRLLVGAEKGQQVDHINRNRLDNRKSNLRICTPKENSRNSSKRKNAVSSVYKGVTKQPNSKRFICTMFVDGKRLYLGQYDEELDAAYYYNMNAKKYFGEFASLNTLPDGYIPKEEFLPKRRCKKTSKYRGVSYCNYMKQYKAGIRANGKAVHIGYFTTERIAAEMYNAYAVELHGEKAKLNEFDRTEGLIDQ
jgi:hypothetical protein